MKRFEVGKSYYMTSICDSNCRWDFTVIGRTDCTIKITDGKKTKTCRINKYISESWNAESIYPLGRYSMAPCLHACYVA